MQGTIPGSGLNALSNSMKHYSTTFNADIGGKGFFDITSYVANLPSGAHIHNIYVEIRTAGHMYVTGVGKNTDTTWYVGYYNWNEPTAGAISRSVYIDILYSIVG